MYEFLFRRLGRVPADFLAALWYALLISAVVYCAFEPQAEFSYLRL